MKWLTRLSILAVFVLGGVVGAPLGMKIERERFLKMQRNGPASLVDSALKHINNEVKLNAAQNEQMRKVLKEAQPELAALERERREKLIVIMDKVRSNAFVFLSEEQKQRYTSLHERMKGRLVPLAAATAAAFFGGS